MADTTEIMNALTPGVMLHGASYNYRIERVLGQGTFGITYLASVKMIGALGSIDANVYVALKEFFMREINGRENSTVTSGSKEGLYMDYQKKFIREAQNLAKLQHPNIIKVIESFEENNTVYYAMEYMDGGSLDERIAKKHGLTQSEVLEYTRQIGAALSFMHQSGMLHLDVKPSNIMLQKGKAVLIDFGLSKQYDSNGVPESSTRVGGGTPGYAPIEQSNYRDGKGFPVTMDVYALGATMFKMLTGKRPPEASDVLNEGFPTEELERLDIGIQLQNVLIKAMSPLRKDRYQSIEELLKDCDKINSEETDVDVVSASQVNYGTYKKVVIGGDYQQRIIEIPVENPIRMPDSGIYIKFWKNDNKGVSKKVWLNEGICNTVFTYLDGEKVYDEDFCGGISEDVKAYLLKNGFLATEHWEREENTTYIENDFGYEILVEFAYKDGTSFVRRIGHAHKDFHALLLNAVEGLFRTTSLASMVYSLESKKVVNSKIKSSYINRESFDSISTEEEEKEIVIRPDTSKIMVEYCPQSPGWKGAYFVSITPLNISFSDISFDTDKENKYPFSNDQFSKIIADIQKGHFKVRKTEVPFDQGEYSESPESLTLSLFTGEERYAKYWIKSISRNNYGNLIGDISALNDYIQMIVPGLKKYLEEENVYPPERKEPPAVRYNWGASLTIFFLGIIFILGAESYWSIVYYELDRDGTNLVFVYGMLSILAGAYLWEQRNKLLSKWWKLIRNAVFILFVGNTLMLGCWNVSLTFAYLVLSCGLLSITSFMFLFNRNEL